MCYDLVTERHPEIDKWCTNSCMFNYELSTSHISLYKQNYCLLNKPHGLFAQTVVVEYP